MLSSRRKRYLQNVAEDLRKNFEEKTGKIIGTGKYFDMAEVISFYGGLIEYADIYEKEYKLEAYICKIDNNKEYDFKFVIDKKLSENLKEIDEVGEICYGHWNMFIMKLFYYVIECNDKIEQMKDGEILYPNPDKVQQTLLYIENHKHDIQTLEKDENKYKLIGTMNLFDIVPDFIYPVFENAGKYYFQNSENSLEIDSFYEIQGQNHLDKIRPLDDSYNKLVNIKDYYLVGNEPIIAFQLDKENIFIGDIKNFMNFIENYKTEDEILKQEISDFKKEIQLSKKLKKPNNLK